MVELQQHIQDPQQPCLFERLSPELRNHIYELAVTVDGEHDLNLLFDPRKKAARNSHFPPITRVVGYIGQESRSVFFAVNVFAVSVCWSAKAPRLVETSEIGNERPCCNGIQGVRRLFNRIGERNCKLMSTVNIHWHHSLEGLADLGTMAVWVAWWSDVSSGRACAPRPHAMSHRRVESSGPHNYQLYRSPPPRECDSLEWCSPPDIPAHILRSHLPDYDPLASREWAPGGVDTWQFVQYWLLCGQGLPSRKQEDALQQELRQGLQVLGASLARPRHEGELLDFKVQVVRWVCTRGGSDFEESKRCTRRIWRSQHKSHTAGVAEAYKISSEQRRSRCHFLELPKPIRQRIYELVCCEDRPIDVMSFLLPEIRRSPFAPGLSGQPAPGPPRDIPPILRLRHRISDEARQVYSRVNNFCASINVNGLEFFYFNCAFSEALFVGCDPPPSIDLHIIYTGDVELDVLFEWARIFAQPSGCIPTQGSLVYHCNVGTKKATALLGLLKDVEAVARSSASTFRDRKELYRHYVEGRVASWLKSKLRSKKSNVARFATEQLRSAIVQWHRVSYTSKCTHRSRDGTRRMRRCPKCRQSADSINYPP